MPENEKLSRAEIAVLQVQRLADTWEKDAGEDSAAWAAYGPQTVSVPFAVKSIRDALVVDRQDATDPRVTALRDAASAIQINGWMDIYVEGSLPQRLDSAQVTVDWLRKRADELELEGEGPDHD